MPTRETWHLDKRVPLALIVTIVLQSGAAIWFAAQIEARTSTNTEKIDRHETSIERLREDQRRTAEQGASIVQRLSGLAQNLERVERGLDQNNALLRQVLSERPGR